MSTVDLMVNSNQRKHVLHKSYIRMSVHISFSIRMSVIAQKKVKCYSIIISRTSIQMRNIIQHNWNVQDWVFSPLG
jgi:hypothetical protein